MPAMLWLGSMGPLVKDLQQKLNLLPTKLARLIADGSFGLKTKSRVVEFQNQNTLVPDGVVGPGTWEKLFELVAPMAIDVQNNLWRTAVLTVAKTEAALGGVFAKISGGPDPQNPKLAFRLGYEKLLKYCRVAAPKPGAANQTLFNEHSIRYLIDPGKVPPMPHWCGIFVLWAFKAAMMNVGTWKDGGGIGDVAPFRIITNNNVKPGDVGYFHEDFQHHFLIDEVYVKNSVKRVKTIEGNSPPSSNFKFGDYPLSKLSRVYSCFFDAPAKKLMWQPNDDWAY